MKKRANQFQGISDCPPEVAEELDLLADEANANQNEPEQDEGSGSSCNAPLKDMKCDNENVDHCLFVKKQMEHITVSMNSDLLGWFSKQNSVCSATTCVGM